MKIVETIPRKGDWFIWYPCEKHKVVWATLIKQWEYDAEEFPGHAAVCRSSIGCCLFPYSGGAIRRFFAPLFGVLVVKAQLPPRQPDRIFAEEHRLTVCEGGHITFDEPTGRTIQLIRHACGEYAPEDANFCPQCGRRLKVENAR